MTEPEETAALKSEKVLKLRTKLETMFVHLDLINSVIIVVAKLLHAQNIDQDGEMGDVLQRYGTDKLFGEMEDLTKIIEKLGGRTKLSEGEDEY